MLDLFTDSDSGSVTTSVGAVVVGSDPISALTSPARMSPELYTSDSVSGGVTTMVGILVIFSVGC